MSGLARPIGVAVGAVGAGVLPMFLTAGLAPRIDADVGFGVVSLGIAVAGFHVCSALAAPRFGRWVERVGPGRSVALSALVAAASATAIAAAGRSAGAIIALLTLAGLANGMSGPAASALLARMVPAGRRGLAFGAQQAGAPLAALLAGLGLSVVAGPLGWRATFVVAAAIGLGVAACAPRGAVAGPAAAATAARPAAMDGATLCTLPLAAVLASTVSTGMMAFLVAYAVDSGMSEHGAGVLLGAVSAVAMVSRVGLGLAIDRWGGDALALAGALLAAGAVGCIALTTATPTLIAVGALVVGGIGWAWTGLFTLAVVRRHPDAPGRSVGVMMSGLFAGAIAGPLLVGAFAARDAYAAGWLACAALAVLAAATVAAARRAEAPPAAAPATV